jgi:hypothetical protein
MNRNRITLGVQSGDIESSEATRPAFMSLRRQLEVHCTAPYSPNIEEFAIVLRICGSLWRFEGEGVQKLRLNKKESYVTVDFVVPESRWKGVPIGDIKIYLAAAVAKALQAMSDKLSKSKIAVDSIKLSDDVSKATKAFLAEAPDSPPSAPHA